MAKGSTEKTNNIERRTNLNLLPDVYVNYGALSIMVIIDPIFQWILCTARKTGCQFSLKLLDSGVTHYVKLLFWLLSIVRVY
jgi:hypothetical protein